MKILLSLFLLISAFQVSFGQELKEGEYWDTIYKGKSEIWGYEKFTKEDVITASKLLFFKESIFKE